MMEVMVMEVMEVVKVVVLVVLVMMIMITIMHLMRMFVQLCLLALPPGYWSESHKSERDRCLPLGMALARACAVIQKVHPGSEAAETPGQV